MRTNQNFDKTVFVLETGIFLDGKHTYFLDFPLLAILFFFRWLFPFIAKSSCRRKTERVEEKTKQKWLEASDPKMDRGEGVAFDVED